eukprot:6188010-Pleurochrysis_carterae.AAC.2
MSRVISDVNKMKDISLVSSYVHQARARRCVRVPRLASPCPPRADDRSRAEPRYPGRRRAACRRRLLHSHAPTRIVHSRAPLLFVAVFYIKSVSVT